MINLILFLPNIDALKRSQSEHKLFLNQSTAQRYYSKSPSKNMRINTKYRMMKYEMKEI